MKQLTLTTFNNKLAVRCYSTNTALVIIKKLNSHGYGTKVKLVKAKRNVHSRHFIILVFPPWR